MSSKIFYGKTHIRSNQPTPAFVNRLKSVANALREQGQKKIIKESRTTTIIQFTKDGLTATFEQYYDDKTITVEGAGKVHYSMQKNQSYYDINVDDLKVVEKKLGISRPEKYSKEKYPPKAVAA
tara:strand:- start:334 stop:705 length:372 start_codon:yes stop_codon:yes gene_type:complete